VNVCAPQAPSAGRVEVLYTHCDGIPLHGPNDIVFDAQGGFWFTDFGKEVRRSPDARCRVLRTRRRRSNGKR